MWHEHEFVRHYGIPVFAGKRMAWVPWYLVRMEVTEDTPVMERCVQCDEQGYLVPA